MQTKTFYQKISVSLLFAAIITLVSISAATAKVIPADYFTDNMVLQQKTNAAIWGTDKSGHTVTVTTSWNNKNTW